MQQEAIESLAREPARSRALVEFFANAQEIFQFGLPATSSSVWRKNLKFASTCYAMHESTKTWRRVQVDACTEKDVRLCFEYEDKRWYSRNSVLLREDDLRNAWQQALQVDSTCDVCVDGKRWIESRITLKQGDKVYIDCLEVPLSLTSSLLAEAQTKSGMKPRFSWRGERLPISLHALQENLPFVIRQASEIFTRCGGVETALRECKKDMEFCFQFSLCCGNGLVSYSDNREALSRLTDVMLEKLEPSKLRVSLPYVEAFMRRDRVFVEEEICNRVELAALRVSIGLLNNIVHKSDALQGIKVACERVFACEVSTHALTKQRLVELLEQHGVLQNATVLSAVQHLVPEITFLASNRVAVALQCESFSSTVAQQTLNKLDVQEQQEFTQLCQSLDLILHVLPHCQNDEEVFQVLKRFRNNVSRVMETLFHAKPDRFPMQARSLLEISLAEQEFAFATEIAGFITINSKNDAALREQLQDACLPALFRCDAQHMDEWCLANKSPEELDAFLISAVEYWLNVENDNKLEIGKRLHAIAIHPQSFRGALCAIKLAYEVNEPVNMDYALFNCTCEQQDVDALVNVVNTYSLFAELVAALERNCEASELVVRVITAQLDLGDCVGTRGNRAHAALLIPASDQVKVQFFPSAIAVAIPPLYEPAHQYHTLSPITVQARATIWDLKFLIANQLNLQANDIGLLLNGKFYGESKQNADFVQACDSCQVFTLDRVAPTEPVLKQRIPPLLSRRAETALTAVFEDYASIAMVLSPQAFCDLFEKCTGKQITPAAVQNLFARWGYVSQPEEGMQLSEFLHMYVLQCLKDESKVRKDLQAFGYDGNSLVKKDNKARLTFDFLQPVENKPETTTFRGEISKSQPLYQLLHSMENRELLMRLPTDPAYLNCASRDSSSDLLYLLQVYCSSPPHEHEDFDRLKQKYIESNDPELLDQLAVALNLFPCNNSRELAKRAWEMFCSTGSQASLALFSASACEEVACLDLNHIMTWLASPSALQSGVKGLERLKNAAWLQSLLLQAKPMVTDVSLLALLVLLPACIDIDAEEVLALLSSQNEDAMVFACRILGNNNAYELSPAATKQIYALWLEDLTGNAWLPIVQRSMHFSKLLQRDLLHSLGFAHEEETNTRIVFTSSEVTAEEMARAMCCVPFQDNTYLRQAFHHSKLARIQVDSKELPSPRSTFQVVETVCCDGCGAESTQNLQCAQLSLSLTQPSLQEQLDRLQQTERENETCEQCKRSGTICRLRDYVSSTHDALYVALFPTEMRKRVYIQRKIKFLGSSEWTVGAVTYTRNGVWFTCLEGGWRYEFPATSNARCERVEHDMEAMLDVIAGDALVALRGVMLVRNVEPTKLTHEQVMQENARVFKTQHKLKHAAAAAVAEECKFLSMLRFQGPYDHALTQSMQHLIECNNNNSALLVWRQLVQSSAGMFTTMQQVDVDYCFDRCFAEQRYALCCMLIREFPNFRLEFRLALSSLFQNRTRFELECLVLQQQQQPSDLRLDEQAFILQVDATTFPIACTVVETWPNPDLLVRSTLERFFSLEDSPLLLLQLIKPILQVEHTLVEWMQRFAQHPVAVRTAIDFILTARVKIVSQAKLEWILRFMIDNQLFQLAVEWMDTFSPASASAAQLAQICFFLPEFEFRSATETLLQLNVQFQLAWFALLKANRRDEQVRVLMGLFLILQQPANSIFSLVKELLLIPVPQDEDRVTDWVVRFLLRCSEDVPEFAVMAMEALEMWIDKVDNEIDMYSQRTLQFPRESAQVLVRFAMGEKREQYIVEHVQLQVVDAQSEYLLFWGVNARREPVELRIKFKPTGEEGFELPPDLQITRMLLPGQSALLYAAEKQAEVWGEYLFEWEFYLAAEAAEQATAAAAAVAIDLSRDSMTFVNDDTAAAPVGMPSPIQSHSQHESILFDYDYGDGQEPDFMFEDDENVPPPSIATADISAIKPVLFDSFAQQHDESWLETGEDPFEE